MMTMWKHLTSVASPEGGRLIAQRPCYALPSRPSAPPLLVSSVVVRTEKDGCDLLNAVLAPFLLCGPPHGGTSGAGQDGTVIRGRHFFSGALGCAVLKHCSGILMLIFQRAQQMWNTRCLFLFTCKEIIRPRFHHCLPHPYNILKRKTDMDKWKKDVFFGGLTDQVALYGKCRTCFSHWNKLLRSLALTDVCSNVICVLYYTQ